MKDLDLQEELLRLVDDASVAKLPGWASAVRIELAGSTEPWATVVADVNGLRATSGVPETQTTIRAADQGALRRWLVEGVDFTHLVRDSSFTIAGDYFDVLLLCKAMRLRPESAGLVHHPGEGRRS